MNTCHPATLFQHIAAGPAAPSPFRQRITASYRQPEPEAVQAVLALATLPGATAGPINTQIHTLALRLAQGLRASKRQAGRHGIVQGLLQEYALSSHEGVALMCLAEALLRIPDAATRDALIRDKIARGQWRTHLGNSPSLFVNAATWGLLLTGKLVATHSDSSLSAQVTRLIARGGEPLIRRGVDMAMRMMGEQFVCGETIQAALAHARAREAQSFRYSYDMLGEAAMTMADAARYRQAYEDAIHAIGAASRGRGIYDGPGISIKLSALHPRYARAQYPRVMDELYPVLRDLTLLARRYDIGLNIDAEEADRLELSLDLLEKLCFEPDLAGWHGIGFVIQAYQKRCPAVVDYLIDLARRSRHRLAVRLVKGAYWDSEIKRAQVDGLDGFPVYTRKAHTDAAYLACARKLLAAPAEIYPQFATHNAHTLAAVYTLAGPDAYWPGQYEFQCLHGMGEPLYEQVVGDAADGKLARPCRIYAPVGTHETLLAYLVRRLLENGANTSFVNRVADPDVDIAALVADPVAVIAHTGKEEGETGLPHPAIAHPLALYGKPQGKPQDHARRNSQGLDLSNEDTLRALQTRLMAAVHGDYVSAPLLAAPLSSEDADWQPVHNPADHRDVVGRVRNASDADINAALAAATEFAPTWAAIHATASTAHRVAALESAADTLQAQLPALLGLLAREAGKTWANGISEVREAIDFLRFYAQHARADISADQQPLGVVLCISPWNFPLAIFIGQIAAALASGNVVIAKPAEQTPLIAATAVRILHEAGIPTGALQLLPGGGETVGARLASDARVQAVLFTGSGAVARVLQRTLAKRLNAHGAPVPLIAETGGLNAMVVDSSALPEQVVADVMASAFDSAGQRCSALRLLCVQDDVADRLLAMLRGAMAETVVGNPARLATDVGPVIDAAARDAIEAHVQTMQTQGRRVTRLGHHRPQDLAHGTFVMPTLIELDSVSELQHEVFGPVLHVVRYRAKELPQRIAQLNASGYGLTLGVHSRIDETIARITSQARVGNIYVNRNMVGAVVGVQPFGGEGLSGTGPKAGGPLYLYRLLARPPRDALARAVLSALPGAEAEHTTKDDVPPAFNAFMTWLTQHRPQLAAQCQHLPQQTGSTTAWLLSGPTGERNRYALAPRAAALCLAQSEDARLAQLAGALLMGCRVVWPLSDQTQTLLATLPPSVQAAITLTPDWRGFNVAPDTAFDVVLHQGDAENLQNVCAQVADYAAKRDGPIITVWRYTADPAEQPLHALVVERATSVNTAAAGGNASLMMIA